MIGKAPSHCIRSFTCDRARLPVIRSGRRAQGDELAVRMREALQKGRLGISALSPRITTGKEQWQEWHHDFFHNQMQDFIQDDMSSPMRALTKMNTDLEVITLREASQTALEVRPNRALTFR